MIDSIVYIRMSGYSVYSFPHLHTTYYKYTHCPAIDKTSFTKKYPEFIWYEHF